MASTIIFDMDGVIVDSRKHHYLAWKKFFNKYGVEHSYEDFVQFFGSTNYNVFEHFLPDADKSEYKRLSYEKEAIFRKIAKNNIEAIPGATALIKKLHPDFSLALASSGIRKNIEFILKELSIRKYFNVVLGLEDIKKGKPDPEIFLKAAKLSGKNPSDCLVIEDSHHGVQAAKSAGMKVIAITTTHEKEQLAGADIIIDDFKDLDVLYLMEL